MVVPGQDIPPAGPRVLGRASAGSTSDLLSISIHAEPVLVLGASSSRHHLVNGHDDRNLDSIRTCPAMKECQTLVF